MAHQEQVDKEVEQLKKDIVRLGSINADGLYEVPFGVLFDDEQAQQYYEAIVGTIKAAKKKKVVDAKGMVSDDPRGGKLSDPHNCDSYPSSDLVERRS